MRLFVFFTSIESTPAVLYDLNEEMEGNFFLENLQVEISLSDVCY